MSSNATENTPLIQDSGAAPNERVESVPLIPEEAHGLKRSRIILLMVALYFNVFLAALDTTVVTTLMGHIASDLEALDSISWVATGYTVAYSAFQPLYGKFSDIWGRKKVSIFSTIMFGIGCFICGQASQVPTLVFGRFVSGVGAGGMLSMSTITVSDYVPLRSRGIFQGIGNVSFGSGASLGGVLGGWLTTLGGWRFSFTAQVPLAIISVGIQCWLLSDHRNLSEAVKQSAWARIDWVGSLSLVSALLLCMLGITTGGTQFAWVSVPIIGSFVLAVVLLYIFYYWETKRAVEPVIPIPILMHRTVISACLTNFFGSGLVYAFLYYTPIFLQAIYGYTYTEIGHRIVVNFVGVAVGSLGSGIIMRRTGKYHSLGIYSGLLLIAANVTLLSIPLFGYNFGKHASFQSLAFLCSGLGYASMLTITLLALIAAVEPKFQATTTAAQYTFRGAGSSLGIALAAALFQNTLVHELVKRIGTDTKKQVKLIEKVSRSLEAIWDIPKKYRSAVISSYKVAGLSVQGMCLVMAVLSLVFMALMKEHDLTHRPGETREEEARPSTPPGPLESEP